MANIRRIAITTGGGDAPGLNAVIRSIVLSACNRGWECVGIREGYNGLLEPERFPEGGLMALDPPTVRYVPLAEATSRRKTVPLDSDTILTARALGICLGE
jgi:hypothetical protein